MWWILGGVLYVLFVVFVWCLCAIAGEADGQ